MANISLPLGIDSLDITAQTLDKQGNIILDVKVSEPKYHAESAEN